jgi:phosphatidylglycerol---prolipoprotein diacylglyceryl transferase
MFAQFLDFSHLSSIDFGATLQFVGLDVARPTLLGDRFSGGQSLLAWIFMSPGEEIFHLGWFRLKWYGVLIASAVLIGVNLSMRLAKTRQIDPETIADLAIWLVLGAIPAARLYYVTFEWQNTYSQRPLLDIIKIWEGGIAIYGAIIGGTIAAIIFARVKQISFWQLADIVAPSLALGQSIGRWGNFFNSEAYGSRTDVPWKLYIPNKHDYFEPTFLYESLWNLLVFSMLMWLFVKNTRQHNLKTGSLFLVYLIAYGIGRFWIEGLRTDSLWIGSLRISQVISLVGITIGTIGLLWLYIRRRSLPDVV